jgi:hypothetical protein
MYSVENNPALSAHNLLPALENTRLLDFVKAYYDWLQSSKITFVNESAAFTLNENIVGESSKAIATIKQIGEGFVVLKMISETGFDLKERITGQTSGSFATVYEIEDNLLRKNSRIVSNRLPSDATGKYFEYLKSEFNRGIPTESTADRRLLAKKIKDLYSTKSNEDTYRFLFNTIYGEEIDFRYPGEDVLRVSDGKFEKTIILRAAPTPNIFSYLNQTIRGEFSNAVANVVDIKRVFFGGIDTAEMTLKLVSGTFNAGERFFIVGNESSNTIAYGMLTGVNIVDAGSGYSIGDELTVTGDGFEAAASVSSISKGPINRIIVSSTGYGYQVGTLASVNNSGTGGSSFSVVVSEIVNPHTVTSGNTSYTVGEVSKVSIVNRGQDYQKAPVITLIDTQVQALGLLTEKLITIDSGGTGYAVDDVVVFTGGAGANAAGVVASVDDSAVGYDILFEDGSNLLLETASNLDKLKDESWTNVTGPIARIELTNFGDGYTSNSLPTVDVTSVSGANAVITVVDIQGVSANVSVDVANNDIGIGAIREIDITNFGIAYSNAAIDATSVGDGNAVLTPVISGLATSTGRFLTDDGKVGVRIIQDSLFYQDFSYVIRSGLPFSEYRSLVKDTLHPAGTEFFGEILISSYILLAPIIYSTIDTEKNGEYVATIKSVLSFFDAGIVTPPTAPEIQIEIAPDVIEVASHPTHHREINVEIALPKAVAITIPTSEREIDFKVFIDVGVDDPYAQIKREIEFQLSQVDTIATANREINVEISPTKVLTTVDVGRKIVTQIQPEVSASSSILTSQEVDIERHSEVSANFASSEQLVSYSKNIQLIGEPLDTQYEIEISSASQGLVIPLPVSAEKRVGYQTNVGIQFIDPLEVNGITFGETKISTLATTPISTYQNRRFEDVLSTRVITTQQKIVGTVTSSGTDIYGTGTSFNTDFSVGDFLIINTEKFIITSIANSSFMEINVLPQGSYTDSVAYRENSL